MLKNLPKGRQGRAFQAIERLSGSALRQKRHDIL